MITRDNKVVKFQYNIFVTIKSRSKVVLSSNLYSVRLGKAVGMGGSTCGIYLSLTHGHTQPVLPGPQAVIIVTHQLTVPLRHSNFITLPNCPITTVVLNST